jgi:hypothetical protein
MVRLSEFNSPGARTRMHARTPTGGGRRMTSILSIYPHADCPC